METLSNVLVIDDEKGLRDMLSYELHQQGYHVSAAANGMDGIKKVRKEDIHIVLTDLKMPGMDGLTVLKQIKEIKPDVEVILMTGFGTVEAAVSCLRTGAFDFITKPYTINEISHVLKKAEETLRLKQMINSLNRNLKEANIKLEGMNKSLENKITERTRELTVSREKYRKIIDDSHDPILLLDEKKRIIRWNKGAELTFGYSEGEILDRSIDDLLSWENPGIRKGFWNEVLKRKGVKNFVTKATARNRDVLHVNITACEVTGEGVSMIIRDITKEKQIEIMKSEFVSNVSHELRTPLTSIKGAVELIRAGAGGTPSPKQQDFLEIIYHNTIRLIDLISDLLDLSKIESGHMNIEMKMNDMAVIIRNTIKEMLPVAGKKSISIVFNDAGPVPQVLCSEDKMKQVLVNLIGNAVKFSPEQSKISVILEKKENILQVNVADNGIGIEKQYFEMIFDKFQQVDSSSTRMAGGTGLGLAIARSIMELHKGKIWVESKPGKGSVFSFTLPVQEVKSQEVKNG
ncbi:MAG: ATP-binding protein [bacterium]|nr:ATP-binding protein [bacterium]